MEKQKVIIYNCKCPEHQFIMTVDDEFDIVYFEIHLSKKNFMRRLVHGLKYIFGYQSKYGAFDEIVLDKEKVEDLEKWLSSISKDMKYVQTKT